MLIKFLCVIVFSFCAWYFGKNFSDVLKDRISLVDEYIVFSKELKSAVSYSGKNIYDFLETNKLKHTTEFSNFLIKNKTIGIEKSLEKYKIKNKDEEICISALKEALVFIENSSDIEGIGQLLIGAEENLENHKKQIQEEYKGKIKIAPSIALIGGLFIALVLI